MNVIILMAGSSDKFYESGCKYPKSLVEIDNRPVVERVVENIGPLITDGNKIIFITNKIDNDKFYLNNILKLLVPNSIVVEVSGEVAGAAISTLLAIKEIDMLEPLVIINGDQIIDESPVKLVNYLEGFDAGTVVFESIHPRWSYVRCDEQGFVVEAEEKNPISTLATAGFYFYKIAKDYFKFTKSMILKNASIDDMFYICPVFNEMILAQKNIAIIEIKRKQYHSLMDPEMVASYENFLEKAAN